MTEYLLIACLLAGLAGLAYALHHAGYSRAALGVLAALVTIASSVLALLLEQRKVAPILPPVLPPEPESSPEYLRERQAVLDTHVAEVAKVKAASGAAASIDIAKGRGHT